MLTTDLILLINVKTIRNYWFYYLWRIILSGFDVGLISAALYKDKSCLRKHLLSLLDKANCDLIKAKINKYIKCIKYVPFIFLIESG